MRGYMFNLSFYFNKQGGKKAYAKIHFKGVSIYAIFNTNIILLATE